MINPIVKKILLLCFTLFLLSFVCVFLFTNPAIWKRLDLTTTSSIGETIGGLTAPLIGIVSAVFLYLTLNKQIDSINDQKIKSESDIIFLLLNQIDNEYNQIYMNEKANNVTTKLYGHEALTTYTNSVYKFYNANDDRKFSDYYIADHLLLIIRSYELIEERIVLSSLNSELKSMFATKLRTFYICKLDDPLYKLTELFKRVPQLNDDYTSEMTTFFNRISAGKERKT